MQNISKIVAQFKQNWTAQISPARIRQACLDSEMQWTESMLNPVVCIQLFLPQVLDSGRWLGRRVFMLDGSSFSMSDTPALQSEFGQSGGQQPGCGFPVSHWLVLMHLGTGMITKMLSSPLRTSDITRMVEVPVTVPPPRAKTKRRAVGRSEILLFCPRRIAHEPRRGCRFSYPPSAHR